MLTNSTALGQKQKDIRENNKSAVVGCILQGETTLCELEKHLMLSLTALNKIIKELISQNVVCNIGQKVVDFGRPSNIYDINPDCGVALSISISHKLIELFYLDMKGFEINTHSKNVTFNDCDALLRYILDQLVVLRNHKRIIDVSISTICVSIPSCGMLGLDVAEWQDKISEYLAKDFKDTELIFSKSTECMAIAERKYGVLKNHSDSAVICSLDDCVSMAFYFSDEVYSGKNIKRGNLNAFKEGDFFDDVFAACGLYEEKFFDSYRSGGVAKKTLENYALPLFTELKQHLDFFDIPLLVFCGQARRLGDSFLCFAKNVLGIDVKYSEILNRSSSSAGATWQAVYYSLKKIMLR